MSGSLIPRARTSPEPRTPTPPRETVLVVGGSGPCRDQVDEAIAAAGREAVVADDGDGARAVLDLVVPALVVLTAGPSTEPALDVLDALRADPRTTGVPVVVRLHRPDRELVLEAFRRQADDVLTGRLTPVELSARLRVRLDRPPLPRPEVVVDPATGALTATALARQIDLELERVARGGSPGTLAYLAFDELPALQARMGDRARDELLTQVVSVIADDGRKLDLVGIAHGLLVLLLPGTPVRGAQVRLERLSRILYDGTFDVSGQEVRLTPAIGYAELEPGLDRERLEDRAWSAMTYEADQLDLHPTRWDPSMDRRPARHGRLRTLVERARTPLQVTGQQVVSLGIPFGLYLALDGYGIDVTGPVYLLLVCALTLTAALIWAECLAAGRRPEPPPAPLGPPPPATAVIAAYLPNEGDTVEETVTAFLDQDYPDLQVILAYNTPRPMPVEGRLQEIAARDPRFIPLRVEGSASKAQNVNAALPRVTGEFVGLFDADHHPAPGSFRRAWQWLAGGTDVVQGHCVVRNGDGNWLTRIVAVEFEVIYAVSHPGRARLHGFGIFGGSNGYWRTEVLERIRMRGFMLTEDIDSSLRVLRSGGRIVSDPGLVSTELGPDTPRALWNQRLRWAQGWSQVSKRHLVGSARTLGRRHRLGALHLLGWREVYPWISLQVVPLLAFWCLRGDALQWMVPVFLLTTAVTLSVGPAQTWFAWRHAHPSIKEHRRWFWLYLLASSVAYAEIKNVMARTAHVKEAMRERTWKVTPRPTVPGVRATKPVERHEPRARHPDVEASVGR